MDILELPTVPVCPQDGAQDVMLCYEGQSVLRALGEPETWKDVAFSQITRETVEDEEYDVMGYSVRTQEYRYTQWIGFNYTLSEPDWDDVRGGELYDHVTDPDENYNVNEDPIYADVIDEMYQLLRDGWRGVVVPAEDL